jgi:hypothetical protein
MDTLHSLTQSFSLAQQQNASLTTINKALAEEVAVLRRSVDYLRRKLLEEHAARSSAERRLFERDIELHLAESQTGCCGAHAEMALLETWTPLDLDEKEHLLKVAEGLLKPSAAPVPASSSATATADATAPKETPSTAHSKASTREPTRSTLLQKSTSNEEWRNGRKGKAGTLFASTGPTRQTSSFSFMQKSKQKPNHETNSETPSKEDPTAGHDQ